MVQIVVSISYSLEALRPQPKQNHLLGCYHLSFFISLKNRFSLAFCLLFVVCVDSVLCTLDKKREKKKK